MTSLKPFPRARIGALLLCCALLPALSGCALWNRIFHPHRVVACTDKPFKLNTDNRPALKVPEGMSAPDTRNVIRIPDLSDHPERARAKTEPCLADPPNYFTTPLKLNLPSRPPKPKHWWTPWRKSPPPAGSMNYTEMSPAAPAPAAPSPATPATPATPAPASPAAPAPATPAPAPPPPSDSTPK